MQRRLRVCAELPPRQSRRADSSSSTRAPASRAISAAHSAALPPPMTRTSASIVGDCMVMFWRTSRRAASIEWDAPTVGRIPRGHRAGGGMGPSRSLMTGACRSGGRRGRGLGHRAGAGPAPLGHQGARSPAAPPARPVPRVTAFVGQVAAGSPAAPARRSAARIEKRVSASG